MAVRRRNGPQPSHTRPEGDVKKVGVLTRYHPSRRRRHRHPPLRRRCDSNGFACAHRRAQHRHALYDFSDL